MAAGTGRGSNRVFPVGAEVRYTEEWLLRASPTERKRYECRTGVVSGYRLGSDHPTVHFPKAGRRVEQRRFGVYSGVLELVIPGAKTAAPDAVPRYFHPQASHVTPDYRDGWNAALKAAGVPPSPEWK